jgi:hypothetical protein
MHTTPDHFRRNHSKKKKKQHNGSTISSNVTKKKVISTKTQVVISVKNRKDLKSIQFGKQNINLNHCYYPPRLCLLVPA